MRKKVNYYIEDTAFWNLALPVWYVFSVSEKCALSLSLSLSSAQEMEVGYSCKVRYISFMLHGVICRKTAIFIVHAVRISKLRQWTTPGYGNTRQRTAKHSRLQLVSPNAQPAASVWMLQLSNVSRCGIRLPLLSGIGNTIRIVRKISTRFLW